ncbi:MAG: hypothetical protein Q8P18_33385 [Pseudomonadota bacterium]|nr:hypothetical protein [Pseudomonadota bacterium]
MPPGRSQQTASPAVSPAQSPAAPARGNARQATLGNAAMQERVGEQAPTTEGGVASAQTALRERTHGASVSVSGRLPANALLGSSAGNELKTEESTSFSVGVGRSGLWARFHPSLLVRPGGFWERMATGGITLSQLYFNFQTGRASLSVDTGTAGDFLDLFMDLKGGIESKFSDAVTAAMPEGLRGGNYDPYTDPTLTQRLSSVVNALGSAFPATRSAGGTGKEDSLLAKITEPELSASVQPKPVTIPLSDGMLLRLDDRASLNLVARLDGTMADALAAPRLRELHLDTDGLTLEHKTVGLLGGLSLHGITFGPDLSVRDMRYTLGAETGIGLLKVLGMVAQLHTGQDLGVRDMESPQLKVLRQKVEDEAKARLPQMLRDQVRQLSGDLPGLPLGQLLSAPKT